MQPSRLALMFVLGAPTTAQGQDIWIDKFPSSIPQYGALITSDPVSGRLMTFGGLRAANQEQWQFGTAGWQQLAVAAKPSSRARQVFVTDSARGRVVVFGGSDTNGSDLGDTWEFDGRQWALRTPALAPAARDAAAAGYDPLRQVVVVFGGRDASGPLSDTWEWNGSTWQQRSPATSPPALRSAAMGYDPVSKRMLLFGGGLSGTTTSQQLWAWDGQSWQLLPFASGPSARLDATFNHDPISGRMLLIGGRSCGSCMPINEVWGWDGTAWARLGSVPVSYSFSFHTTAFDPPTGQVVLWHQGSLYEWNGSRFTFRARFSPPGPGTADAAMTYDAANDVVLRFGGYDTLSFFTTSTMTAWDGQSWSVVPPGPRRPASRSSAAMAYDSTRQRAVLFGGVDYGFYTDTWEWDGTGWAPIPTTAQPAGGFHTMTYHASLQRVVLLEAAAGGAPRRTWWYDGTDWTLQGLAVAPSRAGGIAYDPVRARTLALTAGTSGTETWEYDGSQWLQRAPAQSPGGTGQMTYDARLRRIVLVENTTNDTWGWDGVNWSRAAANVFTGVFAEAIAHHGGSQRTVMTGTSGPGTSEATWVLGTAATAQTLGAGCGGGTPPWIRTFGDALVGNAEHAVDIGGAPGAGPAALWFALAARTVPLGGGCSLEIDPNTWLTTVALTTNAQGFASLRVPVPNAQMLIGQTLAAQAATLDPTSPFQGIGLTPGLVSVIGG